MPQTARRGNLREPRSRKTVERLCYNVVLIESLLPLPMASQSSEQPHSTVTLERPHHWNLYAASLSGLCLIHCLALPMLASLLPLLGRFSEWEWVHQSLVLLAAPATLWVVWLTRQDRSLRWFRVQAMGALLLLLAAAFSESLADWEESMTIVGATVLGGAHLLRWRWRARACPAPLARQQ